MGYADTVMVRTWFRLNILEGLNSRSTLATCPSGTLCALVLENAYTLDRSEPRARSSARRRATMGMSRSPSRNEPTGMPDIAAAVEVATSRRLTPERLG